MDRNQLVTIAVTAAVSVVAKESLTWVVARAKSQAAADAIKQTAAKTFTKNVRTAVWCLFWIVWASSLLWRQLRIYGPPSRVEVAAIVVDMGLIWYWSSKLVEHLVTVTVERKYSRKGATSTLANKSQGASQ